MIKIKLMFDYNEGPIWPNYIDPYTFERSTGVDLIDNDKIIKEISSKMADMYWDYYIFVDEKSPLDFDFKKQKEEKEIMLDLLSKLKNRLNELNDGTFEVDDQITNEYEKI